MRTAYDRNSVHVGNSPVGRNHTGSRKFQDVWCIGFLPELASDFTSQQEQV